MLAYRNPISRLSEPPPGTLQNLTLPQNPRLQHNSSHFITSPSQPSQHFTKLDTPTESSTFNTIHHFSSLHPASHSQHFTKLDTFSSPEDYAD